MGKTKLIVVAGPTASGKTALAARLAKEINGEVISADSMQVYKDMRIATAAPSKAEMLGVPHHMVEVIDRDTSFSAADFCTQARALISDIVSRGRVPVIAGGTGLFIDSLVNNVRFIETQSDSQLREKLMAKDTDALYAELLEADQEAAQKIHKNNKKRVARALEIYYLTGKTKTQADLEAVSADTPYETLYFVIEFQNRQALYERIDRRVDLMLRNGLAEEARRCLADGGRTAAQAIGHKELLPYFEGSISLEEAAENIRRETRRYAKRQITWFKRRADAVRLTADGNTDIVRTAVKLSRDFLNG